MTTTLLLNELNYITITKQDVTTTDEPCYIAYHPEMPTILGQGNTPDQARGDLASATILIINHLLDNNLPVPKPFTLNDWLEKHRLSTT